MSRRLTDEELRDEEKEDGLQRQLNRDEESKYPEIEESKYPEIEESKYPENVDIDETRARVFFDTKNDLVIQDDDDLDDFFNSDKNANMTKMDH